VLVAQFGECVCVFGVGAEEAAVAGLVVVDQERRPAVGEPFPHQVVGHGRVFLEVVHDEIGVGRQQVVAAEGERPEMFDKDLELERKVEQVVGQAVFAEARRAGLRLVVDAHLAFFAAPGRLEPLADFCVREADDGGLVEVFEDLAVEAVAVNDDRLEIALVEQRADQAGHVVLGCLQREEGGREVGVGEAGLLGDERPEEVHHALGQPADGEDGHQAPCVHGRAAKRFVVGGRECALGDEDEDGARRDAGAEQAEQVRDGGGRFAGAGGAFEEELTLDGLCDERELRVGKGE